MKKLLVLIFMTLLISSCSASEPEATIENETDNQKIEENAVEADPEKDVTEIIGVSIVPQETFLRAIVGDNYEIITLIPPGSSPASHQPSIRTLQKLSEAKLYFSIDVPTEVSNIKPMLKEYENLDIIDLADQVDEIYSPRYFGTNSEGDKHDHDHDHDHDTEATEADDHNHEGRDPHIWLSPKRAVAMVEIMTETLIETYPEDEALFIENSNNYIQELQALDEYIQSKVKAAKTKDFIIYHPSYGYLADDYGLNMIEIEYDGKEANINELDRIIELANEKNIKNIYYQEEMSVKQARIVANELNGDVIKLTPLSADYIEGQKYFIDTLVGETIE
ncbi:MAG TPA: zinc ABC transporter substrate-binding protein [Clostridia bacterium]|nr:zinc ABC transporter substrate-binding protein [Clostridia bacterium]